MPEPARKRSTWRDALIGIAITVVLWGIAEVGLRYYQEWKYPAHIIDASQIKDPLIGWKPRPGFKSGNFSINSLGFRGPEFERENPPDVFRIVAMGDSTTFGIGEATPYSELLNNHLNATRPDGCPFRYEVINGGVSGYASKQALARLRYDVMPLKPDLVIIYIGWNDMYGVNPERPGFVAERDSLLDTALTYSYVLKAMARVIYMEILPRLHPTTQSRVEIYQGFEPQRFENNLNDMIDVAKRDGARVMLVTLPSVLGDDHLEQQYLDVLHYPPYTSDRQLLDILWQRYNTAIREIGAARDVPVSDVAAGFQVLDDEGRFFLDTLHFDADGHAAVERILFADLQANHLLPCDVVAP